MNFERCLFLVVNSIFVIILLTNFYIQGATPKFKLDPPLLTVEGARKQLGKLYKPEKLFENEMIYKLKII